MKLPHIIWGNPDPLCPHVPNPLDPYNPYEITRAARSLLDQLNADVVARDYLQFIESPGAHRNTAGWHARGEQLTVAMALLAKAAGMPEGVRIDLAHPEHQQGVALGMAVDILLATPYLWTDHVWQTLRASPPLPAHVISPTLLPAKSMFWSLETAYPSTLRGTNVSGELNWFFIKEQDYESPEGRKLVVVCAWDMCQELEMVVQGSTFHYGIRYPQDFLAEPILPPPPGGSPTGILDLVLQGCSFLHSPFVETTSDPIPRPLRRRIERAGQTPDNLVHVVALRKRRPDEHDTQGERRGEQRGEHPDPESVEGREWKHQWWVTGHHRAQWYAREEAHRVIWIAPYLKGPIDKPVLQKVYKVQR
ncbi:MAG TPA: hypothetical protein VFO16_01620 [Pseudonocardiaceae bacterium]|nr:hypothetical protein [Pseudonocardiaceae bacterium]